MINKKKPPFFFTFASAAFILLLNCRVSEGALKLAYLENRPMNVNDLKLPALKKKLVENLSFSLRVAGGESEGILALLSTENDTAVAVQYEKITANHFEIQVYRVENVFLDGNISVPDPLIPTNPGAVNTIKSLQLYYIKVIATSSAAPGKSEVVVSFEDQKSGSAAELKLSTEVLPISLPAEMPVTIQAGIWPYEAWPKPKKERIKTVRNLSAFLATFRINGVAGVSGVGSQNIDYEEEELLSFYFDDLHFRRVRLPGGKMYNWKKPMSIEYPDGPPKEEDLEKEFKKHLSRFNLIIKNPKWAGKLGFKIWDEPREKDYPYVVKSYRAAKKAAPELKLELSEQPEPGLQNIADVWTPHIKFLKTKDIQEQHRLGKEVWTYANTVHGIDQPLYGMRILGWLLWEYDLDGYLFWAVNWWKEDPWKTVSSMKKDFFKSGTLVYPDPKTGEIYPSLRLEAFRDGIEDMLLLRELEKKAQGNTSIAEEAKLLVAKLKNTYELSEQYDHAPNPAKFKRDILTLLVKGNMGNKKAI